MPAQIWMKSGSASVHGRPANGPSVEPERSSIAKKLSFPKTPTS